jgi:hypothetical protein
MSEKDCHSHAQTNAKSVLKSLIFIFKSSQTCGSPCLYFTIWSVKAYIRTKDKACTHRYYIGVETSWRIPMLDSSWNVMAHGDAREGKWRGNWWMEWVASTLHTTSGHGVSSITTADAHTSAASSGLNWRPCRFKLTRPFRRKMKSGFCVCAITFQLASTSCTFVNICHLFGGT